MGSPSSNAKPSSSSSGASGTWVSSSSSSSGGGSRPGACFLGGAISGSSFQLIYAGFQGFDALQGPCQQGVADVVQIGLINDLAGRPGLSLGANRLVFHLVDQFGSGIGEGFSNPLGCVTMIGVGMGLVFVLPCPPIDFCKRRFQPIQFVI